LLLIISCFIHEEQKGAKEIKINVIYSIVDKKSIPFENYSPKLTSFIIKFDPSLILTRKK